MKTVFVVDDNQTNLLTAKEVLDGKYRAFAMQSAEKMFEILEKMKPDLILLDVEMIGMDGFTALAKLKKNKETAKIPVVFLTLYNDEALAIQAFEAGAADFISKPFVKPILLNCVATQIKISSLNNTIISIGEKISIGAYAAAITIIDEYHKSPVWKYNNIPE